MRFRPTIDFLAWLGEQGIERGEVTQAEIDGWHADRPSTNGRVDTFLFWAKSNRLVGTARCRSSPARRLPICKLRVSNSGRYRQFVTVRRTVIARRVVVVHRLQ